MRYMLLIYQDEHTLDDATREACYQKSAGLARDLHQAGKFYGASPLQSIATATSVQMRGGKRFVTDGPFAEAKEVLGGYWMIRVNSKAEAIEWASKCPAGRNEMIEVRQVQEMEDFPADVKQAAEGFPGLKS